MTVVLNLARLACRAGVDELGPFLMLTDGERTVWLRPGVDEAATVLGAERVLRSAAGLCRVLGE